MASQMKSCRPKTPGGKAVMPESLSLSLSRFTLQSHLPLSPPPHPHSFTLPSLFLTTSLTVWHFKTKCLIISTIATGVLYRRPPEKRFDVYLSVSCLMWSISKSMRINSLNVQVWSQRCTYGYRTSYVMSKCNTQFPLRYFCFYEV